MRSRLVFTALSFSALAACGGARSSAPRAEDTTTRVAVEPSSVETSAGAAPVVEAPAPEAPREDLAAIRIPADVEHAIDDAVHTAITQRALPGAVVAIGRRDGLVFLRAYGARAIDPAIERNDPSTIYDLASLTKPIATATSIALLAERGVLSFDDPASRFVTELDPRITIRHLLDHTSGLPAADPLAQYEGETREQSIARIASLRPEHAPGSRLLYSDLGFVLLGEIVTRASGVPLDRFVAREILTPLRMSSSSYRPDASWLSRIAPTERAERRGGVLVRGDVHDPRAWRLGGVSGNAGLFASAPDLARFARMMLGEGELDGVRVLAPESVRALITGQPRALGWDRRTAEEARTRGLGEGSIGHLGWTGTAIRIDPARDVFVVLLSNDVHPDGRGDVRPLFAELDRLIGHNVDRFLPAPSHVVRTGIDVELASGMPHLRGARAVLITHDAARTHDGRRTLDVLAEREDLEVLRVLAPEHGLGSDREGAIADGRDARTGIEVRGVFGPRRRPDDAMLEGADTLIVDLVDVGARFYTYASTMHQVLLTAAQSRGLRVVILDRPDPLGGAIVEGPGLDEALLSFVNHHTLPLRHGMTMGELARLLDHDHGLALGEQLVVVQAEGWRRALDAFDVGARWVAPSPNLPDLDAVALYPAVALLEGADVSVGRGTELPFRVIGAPWMDTTRVLEALRASSVPGVAFEETRFTPRSARHRGRACRGIRVAITDRAAYRASITGLAIVRAVVGAHRDRLDRTRVLAMVGRAEVLEAIERGAPWDAVLARAEEDARAFEARRAPFLLYE
ncbi:serine hydrolase [Sandaracinus amylolyticus]|uniref:serine hydrolase n=1 Tax=Sandaracinus amylolyticus TaxID=927083 RepID=UPI001F1F3D76|nr:serine hydrolase [Sandaracinus amylolyticus]UJR82842.1 Hypothetical protein I5071_49070 [Sandaracinus amylolyticus]